MRYIILIKGTDATEAGEMPSQELMGEVARFTEGLAKAGALYDATGSQAHIERLAYQVPRRGARNGPRAVPRLA